MSDLHTATGNSTGSSRAARQISLREHNIGLVLRTVMNAEEPLSRAQVAAKIGLTRATVSLLVDQLLAGRLLRELEPAQTVKSGRPGTPLRPARGTVVGLGLEINVDYLGVRAVDLAGETVAESLKYFDARDEKPVESLATLAVHVARVREEVEKKGAVVVGATFGLPGVVDSPHGPLRVAPNLGWTNVDPLDFLQPLPAFRGYETTVANEANLAAVAEANAREEQDFIYVSGEIGVGGALVLDGKVFVGQHGWGSELGHITVDPNGELCTCGARGCLERIAGQEELLVAAGIPPENGEPETGIAGLIAALGEGSEAAETALKNAGRAFGVALSNVVNLFDVSTVVIGGFHAALLPWLKPHIEAEMAQRVLTATWSNPRIMEPKIIDGAALTGAALTSLKHVLDNPAAWIETLSG